MRARRIWQIAGADYQSQIDRLHAKLVEINRRIEELEKVHPASSVIESMKMSAIIFSREVDEVRYSIATEPLAGLLRSP